MKVLLLQPTPAPGFVSGGYRYQAEIGARLAATGLGRLVNLGPEALASDTCPRELGDGEHVLVFESLHTQHPPPAWVAERRERVRLLVHALPSAEPGLEDAERERRHACEAAWMRTAGGVLATGRPLAEAIRREHGREAQVVTPGVSACFGGGTQSRPSSSPASPASLGLRVIGVGSLLPAKGQLSTVRALASILARHPEAGPVRLALVGDGRVDPEYRGQVEAAAREAQGLELELTGCLPPEEVAERLRRADLAVSASTHESYGMAMAETVATGCPLVAFDVGEVRRWVGAGGHLVRAGDERALEATLERCLLDRTHLAALRGGGDRLHLPSWEYTFRRFIEACRPAVAGEDVATGSNGAPGAPSVTPFSRCDLPTRYGTFDVRVYRLADDEEAILIRMGELAGDEPPFVRVHSECFTGEILHSLKCDCRNQLEVALEEIARRGRGGIVYLRQEGRGIGLGNKIRAYHEQSKGADTIEANLRLGFPADLRDFQAAAEILRDNGVSAIELNTNNPDKVACLRANGIEVRRVTASTTHPNPHNLGYLTTKYESLGHAGLGTILRGVGAANLEPVEGAGVAQARAPEGGGLVLMDLDGVVQLERGIPAEARELLLRLRAEGFTLRFLTNDGINSRASRRRELLAGGLDVPMEELYTSSYLAARYVKEHGLEPALVLAGAPALEEFAGVRTVAPGEEVEATAPSAVVVGDWFRHYDYALIQRAFAALQQGAQLLAMHRKPTWPAPGNGGRPQIDLGFWVAGLEYCAATRACLAGKPAAFSYECVMRDTGFDAARTTMVSDEEQPDLAGARALGLATVRFDEHARRPYEDLWHALSARRGAAIPAE